MSLSLLVILLSAAVPLATPSGSDVARSRASVTSSDRPVSAVQQRQSLLERFDPGALLRRSIELNLSDQQVETISQIRLDARTATQQARASYDSERAQLREALAGPEPDLGEVRSHFDAAQSFRSALSWIDIEASLQARQVLTAAQRVTVEMVRESRRRTRRRG